MKVTRISTSSYQNNQFLEEERHALKEFESKLEGKVLLTNTSTPIHEINTEGVKLIIHANSGYDNFSLDFVKNAEFPIIIGNEIRAQAVCEYILFCLFKRLGGFNHQDCWNRSLKDRFLLRDKNILIIGQGHIGNLLRTTLKNLTGNILTMDPFQPGHAHSLDDINLGICDVVILCASLNPTSFHLINRQVLEKLPSHLTLINPARGNLVYHEDLIDFLRLNPSAFAFLDVFPEEPCDLDFKDLKNIFTTSHLAGMFEHLNQKIIAFEKEVLMDFTNQPDIFLNKYKNSNLKNKIKDNFLI